MDEETMIAKLAALLKAVPYSHYMTMRTLFEFLKNVDAHNSRNLMDYKNIGRIFGPIVMRREVEQASMNPGTISKAMLDDIATVGLVCIDYIRVWCVISVVRCGVEWGGVVLFSGRFMMM